MSEDIIGGLHACQRFDKISLRAHQKKLADFMMKPSNRGIIGFHSTGSGKSITALTVARCLHLKTIFVVPSAVISGFKREISRIKEFEDIMSNIELTTYGMFLNDFMNNPKHVYGKLVILDEVHNFRSPGQETYKMIYAMSRAKKVLLLSATPLQNEPYEIVSALCMLDKDSRIGSIETAEKYYKQELAEFNEALKQFESKDKDPAPMTTLLNGRVSYFKAKTARSDENPDYPKVYMSWKKIDMTKEYYQKYEKIERNITSGLPKQFRASRDLSAFFNGLRRASNHITKLSPKLKEVIRLTKELVSKNRKVVIYDTFQDSGIELIKKELNSAKIETVQVTGRESITQKSESVTKFNNDQVYVILLTQAAAAGVNLLGVRDLMIVSAHWNESLIHQIISRGVRYRSHVHLPESKRNIRIHRFMLLKPKFIRENKSLDKKEKMSIDELVYSYANGKEKRMENFYAQLIKCSIEKGGC
jgi:superfamily II DNA or RNA helicase